MKKKLEEERKSKLIRVKITPVQHSQLQQILKLREITITDLLTTYITEQINNEIDKNQIKLFDK